MPEILVSIDIVNDPVIIDEDAPLVVVPDIDTNYPGPQPPDPIQYTATAVSLTSSQRMSTVPKAGALVWDTDLKVLYVGDGITEGGLALEGGSGGDFTRVVFHDED